MRWFGWTLLVAAVGFATMSLWSATRDYSAFAKRGVAHFTFYDIGNVHGPFRCFVPSREASFRDVMLDSAGAALGLFAIAVAGRWRRRR